MAAPGGLPEASPPPPPPPPPPTMLDQAVGDATASPPPPSAPPEPDQAVGDATASPPPPPPPSPPPPKPDQAVGEATASSPPPPPLPKPDQAVGDATASPPPPPETETAGPTPPPPPQNQTPTAETAGAPSPPQAEASNQQQTGTEEVAGIGMPQPARAPPQETAAAAGDHIPAPQPPEELKQGDIAAKDEKDSATANSPRAEEKKPGTSRWQRVRSPVLLLLSLFRLRLGKQSKLIEQPEVSPRAPQDDGAAGDPDKPATEKEDNDGSKRRRHEAEASPPPSGLKEAPPAEPRQTKRRKSLQRTESVAAGEADASPSPMKKKLQNACVLVKNTMAWYGRHRSGKNAEKPEEEENQPAAQEGKGGETKPRTSSPAEEEAGTKSKQDDKIEQVAKEPSTPVQEDSSSAKEEEARRRRRWEREEVRLEKILEDACTRLVHGEFRRLHDDKQQQCLLTFAVFPLGSEVKKQAVAYWWCTRFKLSSEKEAGADRIFSALSGGGFLEPIKNGCTGVIYGCRVNPLVHWMVKRMAREKDCADLNEPGGPAFHQPKSEVLCLTADNRGRMQTLRDENDLRLRRKPSQTKAPPTSTKAVGGPSQKKHEDDDPQVQMKPSPTKVPPGGTIAVEHPSEDQQDETTRLDKEALEAAVLLIELEKKKVILNIDAHVYRLPEPLLLYLAARLEVLQLGRWGNTDDKTYMEVEALESLSAIGKLKNLRYLSVRGLSRLTELPTEVRLLRRLAILDVRGCQNLVKLPSSTVRKLVGLTHLDLTECYMLEHIGRGVAALPELRVFKGFVFGVGKRRRDACRLQHLAKLKKLWKLSVNITTDANVEEGEMKQLGKLAGLLSLTVTWGERPSILLDPNSLKVQEQLKKLLEKWTGLVLPRQLEKLDVRCYPEDTLPLRRWLVNGSKTLRKLYVRGGEVKELDIPEDNVIVTLRLRYLDSFSLNWTDGLIPKLNKNTIKSVEVVDKDLKVMRSQTKGIQRAESDKDKNEQKEKSGAEKDGKATKEEITPIKKRMCIPKCTVDENGVWVRDLKEEDGRTPAGTAPQEKEQAPAGKAEADATGVASKAEEGLDDAGKAQAEVKEEAPSGTQGENINKPTAEEDRGATDETKKVDNGDKNHETVKKEENEREAKGEEEDPTKKEHQEGVEKQASPALVVDQTVAPANNEDIKKGGAAVIDEADKSKISEIKEKRQDEPEDAKAQDKPLTKEEIGDTDEPQTEVEDKGKDDEQPIIDENEAASMVMQDPPMRRSLQSSMPREETPAKLTPTAETTGSPTVTTPTLPPATTSATPTMVETKEPGKAGHDGGLIGTGDRE